MMMLNKLFGLFVMQLLPTVLLLVVGSTMGAPSKAESENLAISPSTIPIDDNALMKVETAAVHPRARPGCCNLDENGQLFALMDRICELCTDMFGQNRPGMRTECSANCFRNSTFRRCLRLFKPIVGGSSSLRRANRILNQMAETLAAYQ